MAHIVEFKVGGLAGRKEVFSAKLDRNINVFFGHNGSGKTSLLKILHAALSRNATILKWVPFEWAEVTIHSVDYGKGFVHTIHKPKLKHLTPVQMTVIGEGGQERLLDPDEITSPELSVLSGEKFSWSIKPKLPRPDKTGSWVHTYLPTWRVYTGIGRPYRSPREVISESEIPEYDWDRVFAKTVEVLWSRYSNQLLSEVQKIHGEGLVNILRGILTSKEPRTKTKDLDVGQAYGRAAAFLRRQGAPRLLGTERAFAKRYTSDARLRGLVSDIDKIEQGINQAMASRQRLEELIQSMFTGNKTIAFRDTGIEVVTSDGENIGLASLSSGEKQVLHIFIEALGAEIGSLLIDEPELSLHIDWQHALISSIQLLNPRAQLILATHSPEIMAEIPDDYIFRL